MLDFHSHSLLSDGVLLPTELARRAEDKGYGVLAITDHVDTGSVERVASEIAAVAGALNKIVNIKIIPGVEITHVPPELIEETVKRARISGAQLVLIHGETIVEPVSSGTNEAGILSGADIIAHPGMINLEIAALAARNGVMLELSGRKGHSLTNGLVAKAAASGGALLSFGSDTHTPDNLGGFEFAQKVLLGSGLNREEAEKVFKNMGDKVNYNG